MGTLTVNATNGQTVAAGASYTVPYPAGKSAGSYLTAGAKITTSDGSIYSATVSLGASIITITNPTGRSIASGGFDYLDLQNAGVVARFNALGEGDILLGPKNTERILAEYQTDSSGNVVGLLGPGGEEIEISPVNPSRQRLCLGDSLTNRLGVTTGDSITTTATSFLGWANAFDKGYYIQSNFGVAGDTSAMLLARLDAAFADFTWGGSVHILIGTNDISTDVPAATTIANIAQIVQYSLGKGATVDIGTVPPSTGFNTAARVAASASVNKYIRSLESNKIRVADYFSAIASNTISGITPVIRTNHLIDGIHPTPLGAAAMGRVLSNLRPVPAQNINLTSSPYDGYNHASCGMLAGDHASGASGFSAGTGMTGTGPRGWAWSRTGAALTATVSKQARAAAQAAFSATDFARGVITVSGADNDYLRFERAVYYRLWSSSGTANSVRRFYNPATGGQYDVLVDGTLSASDETATWPTTPGTVFVSGSATLICIEPLVVGSYFQLFAECYVSSISVGKVQPQINCSILNTAAAVLCTGSSLYHGSVVSDGTMPDAAETGNSAGLGLTTPRLIVPSGFDLANTTSAAGPGVRIRAEVSVSSSAIATVDWGRFTLRLG